MRIPWPARLYVWLFTSFALLVLYGPILAVVLLSFFSRKRGVIQWDTFTFDWYARLLEDDVTIAAVGNSLIVAAGVVPAALVLGTMFAFYYNGARGIGREIQQFIIFIPLLMPPIITGVSLLLFFRELDVDRSIATIMFGHMVFVLALVYRTVLARLQQLSPSLVEASYDLGAGRLQTFWYVMLPSLRTALVTGGVLVLAMSFDETLITLFLTGSDMTMPIRLWGKLRVGFKPDINALVTIILVISTALFFLFITFLRREQEQE